MATAKAKQDKSVTEETHPNEVTFVIPSVGNAAQFWRFQDKISQMLDARVLTIVGCQEEGVITFRVDPTITIEVMLSQLAKMPEVLSSEEKEIKRQGTKMQGIIVKLATN